MSFAEFLNYLMEREGLSPAQLQQLCNIPGATLAGWRNGTVGRPHGNTTNLDRVICLAYTMCHSEEEANQLLEAASFEETIADLIQQTDSNDPLAERLTHWRRNPPLTTPIIDTQLVGRGAVISTLVTQLQEDGATIVLHGIAGVGKTAIAIEVAQRLHPHFPDGVIWIDLRHAVNNGFIDSTVVMSLLRSIALIYGRELEGLQTVEACTNVVRDVLAQKKMLLILDDAFGLEDVRPFKSSVGPSCSMLITSRNQRAAGGNVQTVFLDVMTQEESLSLLQTIIGEERVLTERQGALKIIELVGYLPLALAIVATSLGNNPEITLMEYHNYLVDEQMRLEHLYDWADTEQHVRAAFELSYQRLPSNVQLVFNCTHLFIGPDFTSHAVSALLPELETIRTQGYLTQLHMLSLITRFEIDATFRYRLHPLLKLFSRAKFEESAEDQDVYLRRMANYYVNLAQTHALRDYATLQLEWDNVWGIWRWFSQHDRDLSKQLSTWLTTVHLGHGGFMDAQGYWSEALDMLHHQTAEINRPLEQAIQTYKIALFCVRQTQTQEALRHLENAITVLMALDQGEARDLWLARAFELKAQLTESEGFEESLNWSQRGLDLLQPYDSPKIFAERGYHLIRQGTLLGKMGLLDQGLEGLEKGLDLLPQEPSAAKVTGWMNKGITLRFANEHEAAKEAFQKALAVAQHLGDQRQIGRLRQNLAVCASMEENWDEAYDERSKALEIFEYIGDMAEIARVHANMGDDEFRRGAPEQALTHLNLALAQARQYNLEDVLVPTLLNLVQLHLHQGELDLAEAALEEARSILHRRQIASKWAEYYRCKTKLALAQNNCERAREYIEASLQHATIDHERELSLRLASEIEQIC